MNTNATYADIAYAAGLYEGEGSIKSRRFEREGYSTVNIEMAMSMVDIEPLIRLQNILGGNIRGPYKPRRPTHQPYHEWSLSNWKEVLEATAAIRPWLSARRLGQIDKALENKPETFVRGPNHPPGLQCPPEPIPSQLGYQRHRKLGIPACDICKKSFAMWQSEYRQRPPSAHKQAKLACPDEPIASEYPYVIHQRLGIPACEVCLESRRLYRQQLKGRHS